MTPFSLPPGYTRIKVVNSFQELVTTRFEGDVNALCWQRTLPGDFSEVVKHLGVSEGIITLDESRLLALPVSTAGRAAISVLLEDQRLLRERDRDPVLNCIYDYPRDEEPGPVPTDVFSFHADSATVETDTWLCTYHGPASEMMLARCASHTSWNSRALAPLSESLRPRLTSPVVLGVELARQRLGAQLQRGDALAPALGLFLRPLGVVLQ